MLELYAPAPPTHIRCSWLAASLRLTFYMLSMTPKPTFEMKEKPFRTHRSLNVTVAQLLPISS